MEFNQAQSLLVICSLILMYIAILNVFKPNLLQWNSQIIYANLYILGFNIFFILTSWSFIQTMISDPGKTPLFWGQNKDDGAQQLSKRYCMICHIFKPERAHHCSVCGRCVLNMDHHCPWVNNCIGNANKKFFFLLVVYANLLSWYSIGGLTPFVIDICKHATHFDPKQLIVLVPFALLIPFAIIVFQFLLFHYSLISRNISTIEILDRRRRFISDEAKSQHPNFLIHMICILMSLSTGIVFFRDPEGDNRFIIEGINAVIVIALMLCDFSNRNCIKFYLCLSWLVNQSSSRFYDNQSPIFLSPPARMVLSIVYLRQLFKDFSFYKQMFLNVSGSFMFMIAGIVVDQTYLDLLIVFYVLVISIRIVQAGPGSVSEMEANSVNQNDNTLHRQDVSESSDLKHINNNHSKHLPSLLKHPHDLNCKNSLSEQKATHECVINEYLLAKTATSGKVILKLSYEKESETLLQSIASYDPVSMRMLKANNISKMLKRFEQSKFKPISGESAEAYDDLLKKQTQQYQQQQQQQSAYSTSENLDYWIRRAAAQMIQMKESEDVVSRINRNKSDHTIGAANPNNNVNNEEGCSLGMHSKYSEKVFDSNLPQQGHQSNLHLIVSNSNGGGGSAQNSTLPFSSNLPQIGSTNNQNIDQFNSVDHGYTPVMIASPKSYIGSQTNMMMNMNNSEYYSQQMHSGADQYPPIVAAAAAAFPTRPCTGSIIPAGDLHATNTGIAGAHQTLIAEDKLSMQCFSQRILSENMGFSSPRDSLNPKSSNRGVVEEYFYNKQQQLQLLQSQQQHQQQSKKEVKPNKGTPIQHVQSRNEEEELQYLNRREFLIERFEGFLLVSSAKKKTKKRNKERMVSIGACIEGQAIYVVVEISKVSDRLPKKLSELRAVLAQYETLYQESLTCLKNMCHDVYLEIPTTGSSWRQYVSEDDEDKSDASAALFASDNLDDDAATTERDHRDRNHNPPTTNTNTWNNHHNHHHMISNVMIGNPSSANNIGLSPATIFSGAITSAERRSFGSVSEWKEREEFMEGKNNSLHMALKVILNKIGNLKDLLYLQQSKLVPFIPQQINLNKLLAELSSDFQPLLDERNITFSFENVDSVEYIHNSPKRVKQVLFNLLHNAILYARKDQTVELRVAYTQSSRQIIQFQIINMIDSLQSLPVATTLSMNMQNILLIKKAGAKMKKNKRHNLQTGLRVSNRILSVIGPKNSLQVKAVGTTLQTRFHIYSDSSMHANTNINLNDSSKRNQEEDIMVDSWINMMDEYHKNNQNLKMERNYYENRFRIYKSNTDSD